MRNQEERSGECFEIVEQAGGPALKVVRLGGWQASHHWDCQIGTRQAGSGVGKLRMGRMKGKVMFPGRKVAVWAHREGFLDEVRLESYWMGRAENRHSTGQGAEESGARSGQ